MALPVRDQVKYWGAATAVFLVVLWYLGDVILPFVLGGAVAYFLDPVADRLERMGFSRAAATATITIIGSIVFVALMLPGASGEQLTHMCMCMPNMRELFFGG